MKVLLVEAFGHISGHQTLYTEKLTEALIKAGVEVHLATFAGFMEQWIEKLPVQHKSFLSPTSKWKSIFIYLRRFKKIERLVGAFESFLTLLKIVRTSSLRNYNVIHVIDCYFPILLLFFAFTRGNVLIFNLNSIWSTFKEGKLNKIKRFIKDILMKQVKKKNILSFICHSSHVEEFFSEIPGFKTITTIPWGIDDPPNIISKHIARQYLNLPVDQTIFLIFGVNHFNKSLETIFKAVENMKKDFILIYAGKIEPFYKENDPRVLSKKHGWLEKTLIIDKYIPESEIPYYFYSADAIILSYKKDFMAASGVLSHAIQFTLPVIASDVGQLGEFVKKNNLGLTFRAEDPKSLSEAIKNFINLQEEQKEIFRDNMKKIMAKNSWDYVAQQHLNFYKMCINLKEKM